MTVQHSISMTRDNLDENVHKAKRRKITDWLIVPKSHHNDGLATSLACNKDDVSLVSLRTNSIRTRSRTNSSNIAESHLHEIHTVSKTISNFTGKSNSYKGQRAGNPAESIQSLENTIITPPTYQSNNKELHVKVRRLSKETLRKYMGNQNEKAPNTHSKPTSHSNTKSKSHIPTPKTAVGDVSMMPLKKKAIRILSISGLSDDDTNPRERKICTRKNGRFSRKTPKTEIRLDAFSANQPCNTVTNRDEATDTTDKLNKNESPESSISNPKSDVPKVSLDRSTIGTRSKTKTLLSDKKRPCENILEANIADEPRDIPSNQNEAIGNSHESNAIRIIAQPQFQINEIVWAKLGHFPSWPCKIERLYGIRNQMVEVLWFNDFRRSKMHVAKIYKFFDKLEEFSKDADLRVGLNRAIKEAIIYGISQRFNR